jgi:hypothetical protein
MGPSSQRANECRIAMFLAGFPSSVPVHTVNRQCSSGGGLQQQQQQQSRGPPSLAQGGDLRALWQLLGAGPRMEAAYFVFALTRGQSVWFTHKSCLLGKISP